MTGRHLFISLALALALLLDHALPAPPGRDAIAASNAAGAAQQPEIHAGYARLPLYFIPNQGQMDPGVVYYAQGGGYAITFTADEVVMVLGETVLRGRFVGAEATQPVGADKRTARVNYLIGNDPAKWWTDIPTYGAVVYHDLYPGIDLHYAGAERALKGTYIIAPGADPARIRYRYDGAASLRTDEARGDLLIALSPGAEGDGGGVLFERAPAAWQTIHDRRVPVPVRYALFASDGQNRNPVIGFTLPAGYDPRYPLIIDPTLEYGSYLGGGRGDAGRGIAVDDAGHVYIAGGTDSTDFPTQNAYQGVQGYADAFVAKIDPAQSGVDSLVYATYLGGSGGDTGYGLAVDGNGNAYVAGYTSSSDFPTTPGAFDTTCGSDGTCNGHNSLVYYDVFVTKLNAAGNGLLYSTYLGGSNSDVIYNGIAVDGSGNAYVAGYTWSTDFPVTASAYDSTCGTDGACNADAQASDGYPDIFVAQFNPAGSDLVYATYLGGSQRDFALDLDLNGSGDAYVAGHTESADFPTTTNAFQDTHHGGDKDVIVARLNAAGSDLVYATYLGGSGLDYGYGLAADSAGNAYVIGETWSSDFPLQNGYDGSLSLSDAFVSKLDTGNGDLLYSTFLGGSRYETGYGIAVDEASIVSATGWTSSPDFPTTPDAFDAACGTDGTCNNDPYRHSDVFIVEMNTTVSGSPSLTYATYLGGSGSERGYGIAGSADGNTYVTGETESADFPATLGAYDDLCGSDGACNYDPNDLVSPYSDAFVATFSTTVCREDVNHDGVINIVDIQMVASGLNGADPGLDVDNDGDVDIDDIQQVAGRWRESCP